jgi:hypothetical protein
MMLADRNASVQFLKEVSLMYNDRTRNAVRQLFVTSLVVKLATIQRCSTVAWIVLL